MELTPRRTTKGCTPEPAPDLLLYPLLDSGGPLGIRETDVGRIDLNGISDSGVDDSLRATTAGSPFSGGCDQVGSVVGEWQGDASDAVDIETWVRATWNDHRQGEGAGELKFISEDAI